jgi:hypothetical protein
MELPTDLVTNLELGFSYSPSEGRMWKTDASGTPGREVILWRREARRNCIITPSIRIGVGEERRVATHVIWFVTVGRWPGAEMVIDHVDADPTNNVFANLRECTVGQCSTRLPTLVLDAVPADLVVNTDLLFACPASGCGMPTG